MEILINLYKVMLLLSAMVMLLGFILNLNKNSQKTTYFKLLQIMSVANIISILAYLLNLKPESDTQWTIAIVFLNVTILILNLIIGCFVFQSYERLEKSRLEKQVVNLFVITFISNCIFIFLLYIFESTHSFFDIEGKGFIFIYGFTLLLFLGGSVYPGYRAFRHITSKHKHDPQLVILIILNMLNNFIGLCFYVPGFPDKQSGIILNMLVNLGFAYYLGYYLLLSYFKFKKLENKNAVALTEKNFSWNELKIRLNYWGETRSYLAGCYPELIMEVENLPLTDLEKIHYVLKSLNIKAKEVASALNITPRAVEMQRYRINKKLGKG